MYGGSILFLSYVFIYLLREPVPSANTGENQGLGGAGSQQGRAARFWNKVGCRRTTAARRRCTGSLPSASVNDCPAVNVADTAPAS